MIDVLVVDDDFRVAEINAEYVGKVPGFRVAARAHSAAQALATVERGPIDLMLLDHYLPDQTGLEVVHRMRQHGHPTDVIMVTAARDVATVQRGDAPRRAAVPGQAVHLRRTAHQAGLVRRAAPHRRRVGGRGPTRRRWTGCSARWRRPPAPNCPRGTRPTTDRSAPCCRRRRPAVRPGDRRDAGMSRQTAQRYLKQLERPAASGSPSGTARRAARSTATSGRAEPR